MTIRFFEVYAKHAVLNFGQVLQGLRYIHTHPDVDRHAPRGSLCHVAHSLVLRGRRIGNDLLFTLLPPQLHHTREELDGMRNMSASTWFLAGYSPWQFNDEGGMRQFDGSEDRRWDPRYLP